MVLRSTRLVKHYTDVVMTDGTVGIVYFGQFQIGPLRTGFAASTLRTASGLHRESRSFLGGQGLHSRAGGWTWTHRALDAELDVTPLEAPCESTLHESPQGIIRWRCDAPRADVRMRLGDVSLQGRGYSETLEMTVPPWRVPMQTLRWGRFIADGAARGHMVWIDWTGGESLSLIVGDSGFESGVEIGETCVRSDGRRLDIREPRVIRGGVLGQGPLARIPLLTLCIPLGVRRLLAASERKWIARGTLSVDSEVVEGWVIHELVEFASEQPPHRSTAGVGA